MDRDPRPVVGLPQSSASEPFATADDARASTATNSELSTADQTLVPGDKGEANAADVLSSDDEAAWDGTAGKVPEQNASPLARTLAGRRWPFLQVLARSGQSVDLQRALRMAADPILGEAAMARTIAHAAAEQPDQPDAIAVCGSVAARIVARALQRSLGPLAPMDAEALLVAAHDTARDIAAARGRNGLRLLPPLAELLARRAVARGTTATGVADVLRRIAARIAADPLLGSGLVQDRFAKHRTRGEPGPPSRLVLHGPVEIALHARSLG